MSIAVKSSRNPFRNLVTPSAESSSSSDPFTDSAALSTSTTTSNDITDSVPSTSSTSTTTPSAPTPPPRTATPPALPSRPTNTNATHSTTSAVDSTLTEELPPAYTPGPDVYHGEQTMEYGPTRPFQRPPPPPSQLSPPHRPAGSLSPHPTGFNPQPFGLNLFPAQSHSAPSYSQPPSLWRQITDALDNLSVAGPSSNPNYGYNSYPPQPHANAYPPPSGPPPSQIPDDGRPTHKPVPGHPLLHDGKLLVYPTGYYCEKCHNMGYKHADPTHPCRKCWSKYAKPFKGAITYVWGPPPDSSSGSTSPSSATSPDPSPYANSNFQRPLPKHHPPNSGFPPPGPPAGYPGASWHHQHPPANAPMPTGGSFAPPPGPPPASAPIAPTHTGALNSDPTSPSQPGPFSPPPGPPPSGPGYHRPSPQPPLIQLPPPPPRPNIHYVGTGYGPPRNPGSVVYRPGDPRIGGRLCWKCLGDGKANGLGGLFFDEESDLSLRRLIDIPSVLERLAATGSANARPSRRQADSDTFFAEYDIARPDNTTGFETCFDDDCANGKWRGLEDDEGGADICLDFSATEVGYRIAGDDSSNVRYKCNDTVQPLIVHYTENKFEMGVFWIHSISQTWDSAPSARKRDFTPLAFENRVISASNIDCDFGLSLAITVTDANGVTQTINGTDDISTPVPDALPASVRIDIDGGDSFADMVIPGPEKVLIQFGGDNKPTVSTSYNLQLQVCPD
ncbi:hypothetical protein D9758_005956 [Tetrapyrgos nigripes]|uniref:Uncharacterized protein n=1 Tax=Tetrapyrgos nigripes TaxID=182062 RepID=A0A8H5G2Y3_9AGAR|nr:hypothetical protein D9758_005956 [Tetrapyrgos nigripes]